MNTKRILAALMSVLMLVSLAVPVLAYTTPNASLVTVDWVPGFSMDFSEHAAYYNYRYEGGQLKYDRLSYALSAAGTCVLTEDGALHLSNQGVSNTNYVSNSGSTANNAWTKNSNKYINRTEGATMDVYMKVENLPKITDSTFLRDDGVNWDNQTMPSGILFGGLAFQMLGREAAWTGVSGETSNVTQGVMVYYDNETLGTNAAYIMGVGVRAGTGANTTRPVTFFFNIPEGEYARYTVAYDVKKETTKFYVNGVAQKYDGSENTDAPLALMYYTNGTTTGNAFNICLNGPSHASTSANFSDYYCDIYLDQACVYPTAITPDGEKTGTFKEKAELDTSDLDAWMNVIRDLDSKYYTTASWKTIQDAMDAVDLDKEELTQAEISYWTDDLKAAFNAREYVGIDKLYVAQTASTANPSTAWTCGALLLTESGYKLSDYSVSGMYLNSWTRIIGQHVAGDVYRITKVVEGAYRNGNKPAIGDDEVVPEGGFIFAFHSNEESAAWNPLEGGSQYAAQEFGERNALAFRNMGLKVGDHVKLQNIVVNSKGDSTLSTTGTWIHRYHENNTNPTAIYRTSAVVNTAALADGPQYLARDQFDNFETSSYIVKTDEVPNFSLSVEGEGSAAIEGKKPVSSADGEDQYIIKAGETILLVAEGENFSYWKNAKNNAIVSTEATLSFTFGASDMALVAVFKAATEAPVTYPVTFKDGVTGKIYATIDVAEGTTVDASLIPEEDVITGMIFKGWYAFVDGKYAETVDSYVVEGKTTFVARFVADESTLYTLTIKVGDTEKTYLRRYGALATCGASGNLSYWLLDGAYLTDANMIQISMPNRDVVMEAVFESEAKNFVPTVTLLSAFVDEKGSLTTTFARNIPEGYTFVESGILLTRKATPADLVVETLVPSVTRGVSTAAADKDVFGFIKTGMFDKAGTWYLRGYLIYKDANGNLMNAYTITNVVTLEEGENVPVAAEILMSDVTFMIEGEYDPTKVGTEIFNSGEFNVTENGKEGYKAFFPSTTQANDGTLYVVYYYGPSHAYYNQSEGKLAGVLHLVSSTDNGQTWSEPKVIVDLTDEDQAKGDFNRESRDPNLQKLSDGTLVLTFPVRAPIGKAGLNGSTPNNYWYERAYYMTSIDNGKTWSQMKEIECDYFSGGEPFLYDDPTRTTGCWVKNGSIAELDNGDLLFPIYGAVDCSTRSIMESLVVKAKNNGDGTFTFYKDWANGKDASQVVGVGLGDELAVWAYGDNVYALARNKIVSSGVDANTGGIVYRSTDRGVTWAEYDVENTANNCVNQPNFTKIDEERVLVNYSVPMGSVNGSQKRSARPIFGKLFNVTTGDWDEYDAVTVFDVVSAGQTNTDMGNPSSVLLDDGRIFTVGYSNPSNGSSIIVGQYTKLDMYDPNASSGGSGGVMGSKELFSDDFSSADAKEYISVSNSSAISGGTAMQSEKLTDKFNAVISNYSGKGAASVSVVDGKVKFNLNNSRGSNRPEAAITTVETISGGATLQFNYTFGDISADNTSGSRNRIYIKMYDTDQTNFYITPGKIQLSSSTSIAFTHEVNTEYTVKAMYLVGTMYVKVWVAGTAEPDGWMISEAQDLEDNLPFTILYESKSTSTSKPVERYVLIDNVKVSAASLDIAGLTPAAGIRLKAGKSAWLNVKYDTDLPMSGTEELKAYSDNPSVAKINADGSVTAIASGVAHIVAVKGENTYTLEVIVP